jgi:hypothetical protein
MNISRTLISAALVIAGVLTPAALCQTTGSATAEAGESTLSGTAVSASKNTLIVKAEGYAHQLFLVDRDTHKPSTIREGAEVTVISIPAEGTGARLARSVVVTGGPGAVTPPSTSQSGESAQPAPPIPASVRRLQDEIEHEVRRFGVGFRTGIGLNPEVMLVGVHGRMGPVFTPEVTFRPNAEFGFGEVTKLITVNFDTAYRLPITPRWAKWAVYAGGGPSLGFTHQNFDRAEEGIDFGDLDFAAGLNLFAGIETRKGFSMEAKTTLYASPNPTFRILFGYTF